MSAETVSLTAAHRRAQARISAETVQSMLAAWRVIDLRAIEASVDDWLRAAERIILAQYTRSAALAAEYGTLHGRLELGPNFGPDDIVEAAEVLDISEMRPSLLVTGPGRLKELMGKGRPLDVASRGAQAASARSGQRLAMTGARRTLTRAGIGYRRVTSGKPCQFCAMLAARGAVYHSGDVGSGGFKAHDGCNCHAEPVYDRNSPPASPDDRWAEVYADAQAERAAGTIKAGGNNPALNAMRTYMRRNGLI